MNKQNCRYACADGGIIPPDCFVLVYDFEKFVDVRRRIQRTKRSWPFCRLTGASLVLMERTRTKTLQVLWVCPTCSDDTCKRRILRREEKAHV